MRAQSPVGAAGTAGAGVKGPLRKKTLGGGGEAAVLSLKGEGRHVGMRSPSTNEEASVGR